MTEFTDASERIDRALAIPDMRERVAAVRAEMAREDAAFASLPAHVRLYFGLPGSWDSVKDAILKHDPACRSLMHVWLARTGGVTCPSDIARCDDCNVMFYNEGLMGQYPPHWSGDESDLLQTRDEDGEEYEATLCDCCGRRRRSHDTISERK